jgi:hypothetical protein
MEATESQTVGRQYGGSLGHGHASCKLQGRSERPVLVVSHFPAARDLAANEHVRLRQRDAVLVSCSVSN